MAEKHKQKARATKAQQDLTERFFVIQFILKMQNSIAMCLQNIIIQWKKSALRVVKT